MTRLAVSMTLGLALTACGDHKDKKGDGDGPTPEQSGPGGPSSELAANLGVDFAHVAGFVIGPAQGAGLDGGSTSDVLYTLNDDGTLTVTTVTTTQPSGPESGTATATTTTTTETAVPLAVYATPKYVFFKYQHVAYQKKDCGFVAARKADAALFCVNIVGKQGGAASDVELATDATGDAVYVFGMAAVTQGQASPQAFSLFRLDFTDPGNAQQQVVFDGATDGQIQEWLVNPAGDVLVRLLPPGTNDPSQTSVLRVYKRAGGYVSEAQGHLNCMTPGADSAPNDFHYLQDSDAENGIKATLFRLKADGAFIAPGTVAFEEIQRVGSGAADDPASVVGVGPCSSYAKAGGDVFITTSFTTTGKPVTALIDLVPKDDAKPFAIAVPAFDGGKITRAYGSPSTLVVAGTSSTGSTGLARYDLTAKTVATLVEPGTYDIATVAVGAGGTVTFGGRRAADNARVVGTIAAGGSEVKVVAQALSRDVTSIVQIK